MSIKRATQAFTAYVGGVPRVVHVGDLVKEDDPVLKGRGHLFENVEDHVRRPRSGPVEAATAEPGEKRNVTPPPAPTTSQARRRRTPRPDEPKS